MTAEPAACPGDVVQVIEKRHPWYMGLFIIENMEPEGCAWAYIVGNMGVMTVYLHAGTFVRIGSAKVSITYKETVH